jgi:hypothetical protein
MEYDKDSAKWALETAVFVSAAGDMEMEFGKEAVEDKTPLKSLFGDYFNFDESPYA